MRTTPLGGPLDQPHLAFCLRWGWSGQFCLPECLPSYRMVPWQIQHPAILSSTQLFSVSPFYQWIRMLFTQQEKTKYNNRQHSFILPLMWWWWWETRGLHNPSWAQVWVLPCLSLAVRRRQIVLCPACQAKPRFLLGCTQNLKWRALAPVPALRNGKEAAGVQHSSPQTGPGQTWLGSDSCLTVSQLWGLGLATRLLWASASPSETCLMPSTSYCAWEAVMG